MLWKIGRLKKKIKLKRQNKKENYDNCAKVIKAAQMHRPVAVRAEGA